MTGYELIMLCARFDFGETKAVAKSVLIALASFYNEERDGSWPGEKDLLPCASCERRALFRAIQWLEESGLITVERSAGKGNFYRFNVELLEMGSYQKATTTKNGTSYKNDTSYQNVTGYKNVTTPVTKEQLHQLPKGNGTSYQNVTQNKKKEKIKEKEKTNSDFSDSLSNSIVDCTSSWEDRQRAIEEHNRRMRAAIASAELQPVQRHSIEYF